MHDGNQSSLTRVGDVDGGGGAGMAEPFGDDRDGDAVGKHDGGHEVA